MFFPKERLLLSYGILFNVHFDYWLKVTGLQLLIFLQHSVADVNVCFPPLHSLWLPTIIICFLSEKESLCPFPNLKRFDSPMADLELLVP